MFTEHPEHHRGQYDCLLTKGGIMFAAYKINGENVEGKIHGLS